MSIFKRYFYGCDVMQDHPLENGKYPTCGKDTRDADKQWREEFRWLEEDWIDFVKVCSSCLDRYNEQELCGKLTEIIDAMHQEHGQEMAWQDATALNEINYD